MLRSPSNADKRRPRNRVVFWLSRGDDMTVRFPTEAEMNLDILSNYAKALEGTLQLSLADFESKAK